MEAQIAALRAELLHKEQENERVQLQLAKEKEERERAQRQVGSIPWILCTTNVLQPESLCFDSQSCRSSRLHPALDGPIILVITGPSLLAKAVGKQVFCIQGVSSRLQ